MASFTRKVDADTHFDVDKKLDEDVGDGQVVVVKMLVLQVKTPCQRIVDMRAGPNNTDRRIPILLEQSAGGLEFVGPGVVADSLWLVCRDLVIPEGWRLHVETLGGAFPGEDSRVDALYFQVSSGGGVISA